MNYLNLLPIWLMYGSINDFLCWILVNQDGIDIKTSDTKQNKRKKDNVVDGPTYDDVSLTKMIKKTSHEIISAGKDINLDISSQKQRLRSSASDKKREKIRAQKHQRCSVPKNSQNNEMRKDTIESTDYSKAGTSLVANEPSSEKGSIMKNISDARPGKNVSSSKLYSLKTLETFIETMGIDVPSNRHLLAYNRVSKVWQIKC